MDLWGVNLREGGVSRARPLGYIRRLCGIFISEKVSYVGGGGKRATLLRKVGRLYKKVMQNGS